MRIHRIFLISWCLFTIIVNCATVNLDCAQIAASFVLQTEEIYAGQFPCLPTTSNGTRTLLRLETVINNLNDAEIRIAPYTDPFWILYQLNQSSTILRAGYINVSCFRDTICPRRDSRFQHCHVGGMGAYCNMTLDRRLPCQWIDVTNLTLNNYYSIRMQLNSGLSMPSTGKLDATECNFYINLANLDTIQVGGWRMLLAAYIAFTGFPLVVLILSCIMHSMRKTPSFRVVERRMYRNIKTKLT